MMSLVATPVTLARASAPKKARRTQVVAKASVVDSAKAGAVAATLALTIMAQPALAMTEIGQIADKQSEAKAIAAAEYADLLASKSKSKATPAGPTKTKNLAAGGFSFPSFSAPSLGGSKAPAAAPQASSGNVAVEVRNTHSPRSQCVSRFGRTRHDARRTHACVRGHTRSRRVFFRLTRRPRKHGQVFLPNTQSTFYVASTMVRQRY